MLDLKTFFHNCPDDEFGSKEEDYYGLACPPLDEKYLFSAEFAMASSMSVGEYVNHKKDEIRKRKRGEELVIILPDRDREEKKPRDGQNLDPRPSTERIKKADMLRECCNDDSVWKARLEATGQRLREAYQSESMSRRFSKVLDPKDWPRKPTHRRD